jgi:hypothetical protein
MFQSNLFRVYFSIAIIFISGINLSYQQQIPLQQQQLQQQPLPYAPQQQNQVPINANNQERVGAPGSLRTSVYQFLKQNQQTSRVCKYLFILKKNS